jgi:hypothetical protein
MSDFKILVASFLAAGMLAAGAAQAIEMRQSGKMQFRGRCTYILDPGKKAITRCTVRTEGAFGEDLSRHFPVAAIG